MSDAASKHYTMMTEKPVGSLIIRLAIPTTISMLITNLYNMADTYFVGAIGNSASGAVGVVLGLSAIIQAFGFMLGHGAGSIVSRKLGAKDPESATAYTSVSFFSALIAGTMISVLGLTFIEELMMALGSTATILPHAVNYARFILLAAPFMCASCVLNNVLRYEGKAALAMIGLTTGGIVNIGLDACFINLLSMGTAGAGLATALSQTLSFLILLSIFLMKKTQTVISFRKFTANISYIGIICRTGLPSLMRQGLSSLATMMLNRQARVYGDEAVAAMAIVNKICFFIFAFGLGVGQGFQPVAGTNYGAKKYGRVKKAFYFTWCIGEILLSTLAILGLIFSGNLISFFRDDPRVIEIGTFALRCQMASLILVPMGVCANMLFQSTGKNISATIVSMLRNGICFLPALLLLSTLFGLRGVQVAQAVADVMTFFITIPFLIYYMKKLPAEE